MITGWVLANCVLGFLLCILHIPLLRFQIFGKMVLGPFKGYYIVLPHDIMAEISRVHVPSNSIGRDQLRWIETSNGLYSTQSAYNFLSGHDGEDHHPC